MRAKLVVFDCDGVIADSEMLSADVLLSLLAEYGMAISMAEFRRFCLGHSFPMVTARLAEHTGRALPSGFAAEYYDRLLARFARDLQPTPGFATMLDALDLPICVATSSSPQRVSHTLSVLGLGQRFQGTVFTASQVQRGKPAPDLFLFAAAQMGVPPARAIAVEDSAPGLSSAQAAGMRVLHYTGGAHLRGLAPAPAGFPSFDDWADFPRLLDIPLDKVTTP